MTNQQPQGWMMVGSSLTLTLFYVADWLSGEPVPFLPALAGWMAASMFWLGLFMAHESDRN